MRVHLAGIETAIYPGNLPLVRDPYKLMSFYYIRNNKTAYRIIEETNTPLLIDSGAFSFLGSKKDRAKSINWDDYITEYIKFIKDFHIRNFLELDIDNVVGYTKVKEYTRRIENETGKQCIPVWHKARGAEEYDRLINSYKYVAIGGLVTKEIKLQQYPILKRLIDRAHTCGCKVHGLGFTKPGLLKEYHFDSVDSTNWTFGRYGHHWKFTGDHITMIKRPDGKRLIDRQGMQAINIGEWVKFQKYAERCL